MPTAKEIIDSELSEVECYKCKKKMVGTAQHWLHGTIAYVISGFVLINGKYYCNDCRKEVKNYSKKQKVFHNLDCGFDAQRRDEIGK